MFGASMRNISTSSVFKIFLVLSVAFSAWAQLNRGSITGNITDSSGAAVPAAKVVVKNEGTNAVTETVTNESGQYNFRTFRPGIYGITVESANFKKPNQRRR